MACDAWLCGTAFNDGGAVVGYKPPSARVKQRSKKKAKVAAAALDDVADGVAVAGVAVAKKPRMCAKCKVPFPHKCPFRKNAKNKKAPASAVETV